MTREVCYRHHNVIGLTAASFYEAEFSHPKTAQSPTSLGIIFVIV